MLDCRTCREHLQAWQEGSLDEDTAVQVRLHLEDCEFCRTWRKQHLAGETGSGGNGNGHGDAQKGGRLDPIAMWYDRFEKPREVRVSRRKLRVIQSLLILGAFSIMLLGLRMRGDRMSQVLSPEEGRPADLAALLTEELALEDRDAEVFFPLFRRYRLTADSLELSMTRGRAELEALNEAYSPHNRRIPELNSRLQAEEAERAALRSRFLEDIGQRLGPQRESRLRAIQSDWD